MPWLFPLFAIIAVCNGGFVRLVGVSWNATLGISMISFVAMIGISYTIIPMCRGLVGTFILASIRVWKETGVWELERKKNALRLFGPSDPVGVFLRNAEAGVISMDACDLIEQTLKVKSEKGARSYKLLFRVMLVVMILRAVFELLRVIFDKVHY